MEILSRYNYIFDSKKSGKFVYNSRTNSLTKISDNLFQLFCMREIELSLLNDDIRKKLKVLKIIVNKHDDDDYYYDKKYLKYLNAFSKTTLGLTIATTTKCNFRCPYCYENGALRTSSGKDVNDAIINFISKSESKKVNITWYGGEPLMNFASIKYLMNILQTRYKRKNIYYSMVTNGYLLDKVKVDFLKKFNLHSIQITIDGLKDRNDKTRILANGKGSFDIILKNLKYAINEMSDCKFTIRVNIGKDNMDEYPKLYEYLHTEFEKNSNFYIYHSFIRDYDKKSNNSISSIDEIKYNVKLIEDFGIKDFDIYPKFRSGGCVADSINGMVIDPNGRLYKCWVDTSKPGRAIGTIMKNDNININHSLLSRYMVDADMFNNDLCKNCFAFPVCDGGCPYDRLIDKNKCSNFCNHIKSYIELHYQELINNKNV